MIITRDETFRLVCNFRTPTTNGEIVGTGIFMTTNDNRIWLITAAHIAKDTNQQTRIVMCDDSSNCIMMPLVELNTTLSWIYHPISDLAVLPIVVSEKNITYLKNRCLSGTA